MKKVVVRGNGNEMLRLIRLEKPGKILQKAIQPYQKFNSNNFLGTCLNLVEKESLKILSESYRILAQTVKEAGREMPVNKGDNRALDCAVIQYIHESNKKEKGFIYDTVRCAFSEGEEVYLGSSISSRLHIQVCVRNPDCIKGYFLPRPLEKFNPAL